MSLIKNLILSSVIIAGVAFGATLQKDATYTNYDTQLSTVMRYIEKKSDENKFNSRTIYFDDKRYADYIEFFSLPILVIDVGPEETLASVVNPSLSSDQFEEVETRKIPTQQFLSAGIDAFPSDWINSFRIVLVSSNSHQEETPTRILRGTWKRPPVYEDSRSAVFARGILLWLKQYDQAIDYPALITDKGQQVATLLSSASAEPKQLNQYEKLSPQELVDKLHEENIDIHTMFIGSSSSDVIKRIDARGSDYEEILPMERQQVYLMGQLQTAVQLYRLLPANLFYQADPTRTLSYGEKMLRRLRFLGEVSGAIDGCKQPEKLRHLGQQYYEQLLHTPDLAIEEVRLLQLAWQETTDTSVQLPEWIEQQRQSWIHSGSKDPLVAWVAHQIAAKQGVDWVDWATNFLEKNNRIKIHGVHIYWEQDDLGLTWEEYKSEYLKYKFSGSEMKFAPWLAWRDGKAPEQDTSNDMARWEDLGLKERGMPFETFRLQQSLNWVGPSRPLVQLSPEERKLYEVTVENGYLMRDGKPINTTKESTQVSGAGYAAWVIDCKGNLYVGSHITRIFYHSSFVSNAPIQAAGEIKTDEHGRVIYINNKSGHYWPGREETIWALNWYADRGVDLNSIIFHAFTEGPRVIYDPASSYINK
ncbi:MAG: hypothetical protein Q8K75_06985 [Chlamydiales bacterium]|nr:hypothetical protein [Chlamydiales bacterium]